VIQIRPEASMAPSRLLLHGEDRCDLHPLDSIKAVDPRTLMRNGGWQKYLVFAYRAAVIAREHVPPNPYESDVIEDRFLVHDIESAISNIRSVAQACGVELTLRDE